MMKEIILAVKRYFKTLDWLLLSLCVGSSIYGLVLISSAVKSYENSRYLMVQAGALAIGIFVFFLISAFDISHLAVLWKFVLVFGLLFLSTVFFFGSSVGGNKSWLFIPLGSFKIGVQPGEIVKILMIITVSKHMTDLGTELNKLKNLAMVGVHFLLYAAPLVVFSKDDGMTLSYCVIFAAALFAAGVYLRYFLIAGVAVGAALPLLWNYVMSEYQRMRFLVVLDPTLDLSGKGYHAYQSKIAIRTGGIFGTGLYQGPMTQYGHLPVKESDFLFSVACEELGLIGAIGIILLLSAIIAKCFITAYKVRHDRFSFLVCVGVGAMLIFQTFLNIGMCLGIAPVVGLTLPFFSYGGSSLLTMFLSLGLVCSVGMHARPRAYSDQS